MIQINNNNAFVNLNFINNLTLESIDCLIILNSDIPSAHLQHIIDSSRKIILCDGGANTFYESKYRDYKNVVAIVGDLDSIRPDVRHYYQQKKIDIKDLSHDQDTNDLQKSINYAISISAKTIACLGLLGKRFDQQMCNLSVLQKYSEHHQDVQFLGIGKSSLVYVVKPQVRTTIKVSENSFIRNQAGMIVFGKAKVQTKGFKWNLGEEYGLEYLEWGVLVSSSNEIVGEQVQIKTSHPLFFTIQFS